jgi:hypothetical protein
MKLPSPAAFCFQGYFLTDLVNELPLININLEIFSNFTIILASIINLKFPLMKKLIISIFILSSFLYSCNKADEVAKQNTYTVKGCIQKGPFTKGTVITISELKSDLSATGRNFQTTTIDNKGTFEIPKLELSAMSILLQMAFFTMKLVVPYPVQE